MRLNQRQRAFLDAVTHEMKTPLASLRLYVETLVRHDPAPADRGQFLQRMREDVERLERSVDQILAAARAEVRLRRRSLATIELPDLLERCAQEVRDRYKLPASAVRVDAELPARVRGDPEELELAFCNLLDNAVKYSPTAVEVVVVVRADGEGRIGVEIADRGVGIPRRELRASGSRSPIEASGFRAVSCVGSSSRSTGRAGTCSAASPASAWACSSSDT
jgi:signal transduction histidine kinase